MVSSGLLGAELNIPTFGWISSDPTVQDKSQYSTLVRLLWPVSSIGKRELFFEIQRKSLSFLYRRTSYIRCETTLLQLFCSVCY